MTKYSGTYQSRWCHALYDSREVGQQVGCLIDVKLADYVMPMIDPTDSMDQEDEEEVEDVAPFVAAKKVQIALPGIL